ncbi:MAG: Sec-independent protein tatd [uncultured bacterium]|nr:MAG: Sec-independent protein tatd [uncultured bacterium]HBR71637.1 hydrolase TatD [Candidatus Moranbacteria bacterium]
MNLIDTHAHVNFSAFKEDGEDVLRNAIRNGVFVVNVGSQYSTSKRAVEYAKKFFTGVYAIVGIHPVHLKKGSFMHQDPDELEETEIQTNGEQFEKEKYLELAQEEKVVAIGEIGLDYHHFVEGDNIEAMKIKQKEVLIKFIELANEVEKPVMIHCWGVKSSKELDHARADAYDDLLEILQKYPVDKKGVVHSFVGSYKTAKKFIELGYKIGLNGIVTYGESYDRLIREIDLKNILLETDCPYLTPRPLEREKRNEPIFVKYIAQKIADVKGISVEEVAEQTTKNAKAVFGI